MHLDLRYPIAALLLVYGAILVGQGALTGATVLGLNVNVIWGAVMLASGGITLFVARRFRK